MDVEKINQEVLKLWEQTFDEDAIALMPLIYPALKEGTLLFIGLNPSFGERFGFLEDVKFGMREPKKTFQWRNRAKFDFQNAQQIEFEAKKKYAYYAKFREIAEEAHIDWEHVDLFFYRETSQSDFQEIIFRNKELTEFGKAQLELSKKLIIGLNPIAVVVANALASRIFERQFNATFDENSGYHTIQISARTVPVFLGSMLTGQRAMDNYSYRRLKWHIKRTIGQKT